MNNLDLNLELEYDLIEKKDAYILSSNDIQNDILNLVKLSENKYLYTLTFEQILKNPDALLIYNQFDYLARNIFNYVNDHNEYLMLMVGLIKYMRYQEGFDKRLLSYCLLDILSEYYPNIANELFLIFVKSIGCWKDLKYFYSFAYEIGKEYTSSVIEYSIQLANEELKQDLLKNIHISNVAKWIPREKSKYKKLYERLVLNYFKDNDYFKHVGTFKTEQIKKAMNKAKMEYRKILSKLNKQLDTVQIKQCSKQWQKIEPNKQTSLTLKLQINAFLNLSRNSDKIRYESSDRIICAQNFIDTNNINKININKSNKKNIKNINTFSELFDLITKYSNL
jgi:hypothetical protein